MDLESALGASSSLPRGLTSRHSFGCRRPGMDDPITVCIDTEPEALIEPESGPRVKLRGSSTPALRKPPATAAMGPPRLQLRRRRRLSRQRHWDLFICVQIEKRRRPSPTSTTSVQVPAWTPVALGPYDLAASMGYIRHPEQPEVVAAIQRVIDLARKHGLWVGLGGPADEAYAVRATSSRVFHWLQSGSDFEYMSQSVAPFLPAGPGTSRQSKARARPRVQLLSRPVCSAPLRNGSCCRCASRYLPMQGKPVAGGRRRTQ